MIKVLVVEDDHEFLDYLNEYLDRKAGLLCSADNAKEGLALFNEHSPQILIVDYRLPDKNGVELAVLAKKKAPKTVIIMITANKEEAIKDASTKCKIDYFISKPILTSELSNVISEATLKVLKGGKNE